MANRCAITGELAEKVLNLHRKGANPRMISLEVGVARGTINSFLCKKGITPNKRKEAINVEMHRNFIEEVKDGVFWTHARLKYGIEYDTAKRLLADTGITPRTRKMSAQDKILSEQNVLSRCEPGTQFLGKERGKYKLKDSDGRIYFKSASHLEQGSPFGKFGRPLTEQEFAERLKETDYTLVSGTFSGMKKPVTVICAKGHRRELARASWAIRFDCDSCGFTGTSKEEIQLLEWIKTFYPSAAKMKLQTKGSIGRRKEIDIFIPEISLGIEYCGLYYHSAEEEGEVAKVEKKHYRKMLDANTDGIRLITIFSNEWLGRQEQVKAYLMSAIGKNPVILAARKCQITEISSEVGRDFLEGYHIQGSESISDFFIGIKYDGELVDVMSGGRHPRRAESDETSVCLNRLAFKAGITVVGGASKMFSKFKEVARKLGKLKIVSWSDNRWSEGKIYEKLGFSLERPMSSSGIKKGLSDGSIWPEKHGVYRGELIGVTKAKSLESQGVKVIYTWDCGKKRWVFLLPLN